MFNYRELWSCAPSVLLSPVLEVLKVDWKVAESQDCFSLERAIYWSEVCLALSIVHLFEY